MSVREVFTPEIAQPFGQFEDFPERFADLAALQGVNREWARNYWAAHWGLPSPEQAFEMFHREIIGPDELNKLFRALDILPHWRDRMLQMSYRPMPRVDIRRLHAAGIVTDAELPKLYLHFGFSPTDAGKMAEFTKRLNKGKNTDNADELVGITKAMALRLY